jgi:tetratricopeptide (TPR) repeat protein
MKKTPIILLCVLVSAALHAQTERSLIRDGNRSYKENNFTDAEVNYRKALEKNKDLTPGTFDLGDALYKQGRFGEAAEAYGSTAAKVDNPGLKAQALHNLGNALLKEQKLPESIGAYKEALKLHPNDADTKYNLEYAKALLKRQQEQQKQQKQQNKDQKKDDKQKQDQQKQDQEKKDQEKKDQEKQDQQKQDQPKDQKQNDQQKQAQQKKQQISKEDAERILQALNNEEKNVQKKLHHKIPARVKVEKDW